MFRRLVQNVRAAYPDYLTSPFDVSELYQVLVPYRHNRRELGIETNQDYELALVRLLAGERGYLLGDEAMQQAMQRELASKNPDTGLFRAYATNQVTLSPGAVRQLEQQPLTGSLPQAPASAPPRAAAPAQPQMAPQAQMSAQPQATSQQQVSSQQQISSQPQASVQPQAQVQSQAPAQQASQPPAQLQSQPAAQAPASVQASAPAAAPPAQPPASPAASLAASLAESPMPAATTPARSDSPLSIPITRTAAASEQAPSAPPPAPPRPTSPPAAAPRQPAQRAGAEPAQRPLATVEGGGQCRYCGGGLPDGRRITFCPHCGQNLTIVQCPACSSELEIGWKFCTTCGRTMEETAGAGGRAGPSA